MCEMWDGLCRREACIAGGGRAALYAGSGPWDMTRCDPVSPLDSVSWRETQVVMEAAGNLRPLISFEPSISGELEAAAGDSPVDFS